MTCGVGGQGLMLVSNIIGLACAEFGIKIRTAEVHGLAQRSGSIYTHIRIGNDVHSSLIPYGEANVLLGMEAIETLRNCEYLKSGGDVILNKYIWYPVQSTFRRVQKPDESYLSFDEIHSQLKKLTDKIHIVDALELANQAGHPLTTNVVILGALAKIKGFPLAFNMLEQIVPKVAPEKAIEANLNALTLGYDSIE